jgi:hypothetical protein
LLLTLAGVLIGGAFLGACAPRAEAPVEKVISQEADARQFLAPAAGAPEAPLPEQPQGDFASASTVSVERMVIKNANLSIIVKSPAESVEAISKMADEMGGYVVSANLYKTRSESGNEVPRGSITIRVPAEKLNDALKQIKALSTEAPLSETIDSQDITNEYTDLESRLRNLKDTEEQLRKIMDEAFTTEDVLKVYNQLTQVREQIEVIEGQMKYYRESAALSAISTELIAEEAVEPLSIGGWKPVGVARDALQALINALRVIVNVFIWVVIFVLPVLSILYVIFVLPVVAFVRYLRKRRKNRKVQNTPPAPPQPQDQ